MHDKPLYNYDVYAKALSMNVIVMCRIPMLEYPLYEFWLATIITSIVYN